MKIIKVLNKAKNHLIRFIHLQLFITLISIPILLYWGMPISALSFAGNLLFSPILTAFLLLSSLTFFLQIAHIPNSWLIYCLEQITRWWLALMQWGSSGLLIALPLPSVALLILIALLALAILHHKKVDTAYKGIICYSLLLCAVGGYLKFCGMPLTSINTLACNKGHITIIKAHNQLIIIDPGVIGRRLSAPSWCEYTLLPHLAKQYGANSIDHLIVLQPNRIIFDALASLQEKICIKNLYLPLWEGQLPFYWWRSYSILRKQCSAKQCKLIRIASRPLNLQLESAQIQIDPLDAMIEMDGFSYPCLHVHGTIDNQELDIYSAKYEARNGLKAVASRNSSKPQAK